MCEVSSSVYLFSRTQSNLADGYSGLLKACETLPRKLLVIAIKAIKHLATSPQLIEVLQNSSGLEFLVSLLAKNIKGSHSNVC